MYVNIYPVYIISWNNFYIQLTVSNFIHALSFTNAFTVLKCRMFAIGYVHAVDVMIYVTC